MVFSFPLTINLTMRTVARARAAIVALTRLPKEKKLPIVLSVEDVCQILCLHPNASNQDIGPSIFLFGKSLISLKDLFEKGIIKV